MSISDEDSNNTIILNREGEQNSFNDTDDFQLSKNDKLYQFPQNYREKRFNSRYTKKVNSNQKTNSTISCNISNVRVPTRAGTLKEKPNNKSHLTENDIKLLNIMNLENDKIKKVKETSITIVRSISATTNSEENWFEIISNWHDYVQNQPLYIRELLRRGLPKEFRSAIWKLMIPDTKKDELLDCYQKLSIQNKESPYERILKVDVERTYPDRQKYNQVNNGQQMLHTLLKNYSIYDKEVGYCQGMAFIMGHLIEYLSEQQAFLIFERIMNFHQLRFVFVPKMPLIKLLNYQISCIIKEDHNDLYKHFSEIDLNFLTFTSPWIMTCYALSLPFDTCSRLINYNLHEWKVSCDFKLVSIIMGLQDGKTKYLCIFCLFDATSRNYHYSTLVWSTKNENVIEETTLPKEINGELNQWFQRQRTLNISISGNILKEMALEIASILNLNNFNASTGESKLVSESKMKKWKELFSEAVEKY
ncbi:hypothetical protein A3Q56_03750, partial [Intoshia linei]